MLSFDKNCFLYKNHVSLLRILHSLAIAIKIISSRKIITRCLRKVSAPYDNHHPLRKNASTVIVILSIDMLLLTDKLNLECYVLYETKELLSIVKIYITIINIPIFIINIAIVNIIITIVVIVITILLPPLALLSYSLNPHGGYAKSGIYLLQFFRHMTSDSKFSYMFFYLPFLCSKATAFYELK